MGWQTGCLEETSRRKIEVRHEVRGFTPARLYDARPAAHDERRPQRFFEDPPALSKPAVLPQIEALDLAALLRRSCSSPASPSSSRELCRQPAYAFRRPRPTHKPGSRACNGCISQRTRSGPCRFPLLRNASFRGLVNRRSRPVAVTGVSLRRGGPVFRSFGGHRLLNRHVLLGARLLPRAPSRSSKSVSGSGYLPNPRSWAQVFEVRFPIRRVAAPCADTSIKNGFPRRSRSFQNQASDWVGDDVGPRSRRASPRFFRCGSSAGCSKTPLAGKDLPNGRNKPVGNH